MKRYDAVNTNGDPLYAPSPDGEMVFYSDVVALVAMNAELVEALELADSLIHAWKQDSEDMPSHIDLEPIDQALLKAKELSHGKG